MFEKINSISKVYWSPFYKFKRRISEQNQGKNWFFSLFFINKSSKKV